MKRVYQTISVWFWMTITFCMTAEAQRTPAQNPLIYLPLARGPQALSLYRQPTLDVSGQWQRFSSAGILPVGLDWRRKVTSHWDVAFLVEYDLVGLGAPHYLRREWTEEISDMRTREAEGQGVLAAIQFIGNYLEQDFVIQPYYRVWDVQKMASNHHRPMSSSLSPQDNDPGQAIREYGIHLTWRF